MARRLGELEEYLELGPIDTSGIDAIADTAQARMPDTELSRRTRVAGSLPKVAVEMGPIKELSRTPDTAQTVAKGGLPGVVGGELQKTITAAAPRSMSEDLQMPTAEDEDFARQQMIKRHMLGVATRAGVGIGAAIGGVKADTSYADGMIDRAGNPVGDLEKRRAMVRDHLQKKLQGQREDDRFSYQKENDASERLSREKAGEASRTASTEENRLQREHEARQRMLDRANAERIAKTRTDGKGLAQVPAGEASQVAELGAAEAILDDLDKKWEAKANQEWVPDRVSQYIPGTKANQYDDDRLASAQMIGTIMEGGKLTDSDLKDKYLPLMPTAGDGAARKAEKIKTLRGMLQAKRTAKVQGLGQAGFDTSGFPAPAQAQQAPSAAAGKISPSGKPYARKLQNPASKKTRFVDANGQVVEEVDGLV